LKSIAKWRKITCERAIKACIDGQHLAPRKTEYKYHYRLFADYLEILQIELDRIIEIQEYMEDQEDMIKFKTEIDPDLYLDALASKFWGEKHEHEDDELTSTLYDFGDKSTCGGRWQEVSASTYNKLTIIAELNT
jgi:hypothetical protein